MTAATKRVWPLWLGRSALVLALIAAIVAVAGPTLARFDAVPKLSGFMAFVIALRSAMWIAALAALALVLGWIVVRRTSWAAVVGLVLAAALLAVGGWLRGEAESYPAIHDVTTDLDNPPAFAELAIPDDNLRGVETEDEWRRLHREGYADIAPVEVVGSVSAAIARAERLARARGWTVASADRQAGRMEAVAYAGWPRFEDIVVLTARPASDGGTRLDMRSISRVGVSDLGYNGKRIREFLGAMAAAEDDPAR